MNKYTLLKMALFLTLAQISAAPMANVPFQGLSMKIDEIIDKVSRSKKLDIKPKAIQKEFQMLTERIDKLNNLVKSEEDKRTLATGFAIVKTVLEEVNEQFQDLEQRLQ